MASGHGRRVASILTRSAIAALRSRMRPPVPPLIPIPLNRHANMFSSVCLLFFEEESPTKRGLTMNKPYRSISLALLLALGVMPAHAKQRATIQSPASGVLCDRYVCANEKGISHELTKKYLGKKAAANKLFTTSDVDLTEFTFANGIFCDAKERLCREDRYYGANGQRSGTVSKKYTKALFGE